MYTVWAQGPKYTYHSPNDPSTEILNRRWDDLWNTNLGINKLLFLSQEVKAVFSIKVVNPFNQRTLRLFTADYYEEDNILPYKTVGTGAYQEDITMDWTNYDHRQLPREVYFGIGLFF